MTKYVPTHDDIVLGKIHLGDNFWRELSEDEVRRGLNEIRAEAWDEAETAIHEWYKTYQETLYTAPENPYRPNEK